MPGAAIRDGACVPNSGWTLWFWFLGKYLKKALVSYRKCLLGI